MRYSNKIIKINLNIIIQIIAELDSLQIHVNQYEYNVVTLLVHLIWLVLYFDSLNDLISDFCKLKKESLIYSFSFPKWQLKSPIQEF